jgi:SAM-dependent methyltransferase
MGKTGPSTIDPDAINRRFFSALWSETAMVAPERFNTWPLLSALAEDAPDRLEVGCGLRPRLPVAGTCFVDISREALPPLAGGGGRPAQGAVAALPFRNGSFDLVGAFDVIEHVADDRRILREFQRVTRPGATIVLSVPLDPRRWGPFDELVGHVRRYEAAELPGLLRQHDLVVERSAPFGMEPRSRMLLRFAAWGIKHRRDRAMWWYNAVFMPIGLRLQRPLAFAPGMTQRPDVSEVLLVCRRLG